MLISKTATVAWNARNKAHFVERGYKFTKMRDKFLASVDDLTDGSNAIVTVQCDYCGKQYCIRWEVYQRIRRRSQVNKDACKDCCEIKANEAITQKFGSHSGLYAATQGQRSATNLIRYGAVNPFANEQIKSKIVETNLEKYGVPHTQQCREVRNKTIATCQQKYGVDNYVELFKGKYIGENSPVWKNDVTYIRSERATHEYNTWRKSVFARDHYTCQRCGAHSEPGQQVVLNAHHIHNWKDNVELRYRVDNGITLCKRCHIDFHRRYGKSYNTSAQLMEFLDLEEIGEKVC